ncbi:MAG: DNA ligase, partial [Deltaproteobacteria bacterium]|nr:DNA ligase [Deltaproteobacteria bacterium]
MNDINTLVETLQKYNDAYRGGSQLVSDHEYDRLVESLRRLDPNHPFLHSVEPEKFNKKREVKHPVPMLSTEKAYSKEDLKRFVTRVVKAASEIGIRDVRFRVTPKLDGLAGRDDGSIFATR